MSGPSIDVGSFILLPRARQACPSDPSEGPARAVRMLLIKRSGPFTNGPDNTLTVFHLVVPPDWASLSFKKLPRLKPLVFQRNKHRDPLTDFHRSKQTRRLKRIVFFP